MSRRLSSSQQRHYPGSKHVKTNRQRINSLPTPIPAQFQNYINKNYDIQTANAIKSYYCNNATASRPSQPTTIDIGCSEDATSDSESNIAHHTIGFHHNPLTESDDDSERAPYFGFNGNKSVSDRYKMKHPYEVAGKSGTRKIYPNQEGDHAWDAIYQEIQSPSENGARRLQASRLSDRPQSIGSSNVASAIVSGCGGKCQTFENICYFFLQLVFTMGILVGMSLCIAGLVLRKSAARNLQVLVYIGVLLSMVSALLLVIQLKARNEARKRLKAIQMSKRSPIQMETLNLQYRLSYPPCQQMALNERIMRLGSNVPEVHQSLPKTELGSRRSSVVDSDYDETEQYGIPWWRRQDINVR